MQHSPVAPGGAAKPPLRVRKYRDLKDQYVGEVGTPERTQFEFELSLELLPLKIREFRKEQKLTQAELGARLGIHKAQVSKLERSAVNVTVATLLKVFAALHTKLKLGFEPLPVGSPHVVAIFIFSVLLNALAQQPCPYPNLLQSAAR